MREHLEWQRWREKKRTFSAGVLSLDIYFSSRNSKAWFMAEQKARDLTTGSKSLK